MSKVNFTPEQQRVIDLRNSNILVSAAAGSGKTAVLTERIVNMVCDEEHPVDIDRLLVVTFTNAAAAEMRERIGNKLSERLQEKPESKHIQRQLTLLHAAQITTIDSFCLFLLKNHFQEIGLDPAFRVSDEREIKLMQQEALAEVLEEAYAQGSEEFHHLVEFLCPGSSEKALEGHILSLSRFAASFPWPKEWLLARMEDYAPEKEEDLENSPFWRYYGSYVSGMLKGFAQKAGQALWIANCPDGPYMYADALEHDQEQYESLACYVEEHGFDGLGEKLSAVTHGKLSPKKDDSVNADKREQVKNLYKKIREGYDEFAAGCIPAGATLAAARDAECLRVTRELIRLVLAFDERMQEKKQEKKLIDFTDMEHFALDILLKREGDVVSPSQVALQYRDYFHEILIDEYQDSNLVQEYLLRAVSGEESGNYNRFMVGDVKQSIYHFRLARPELFIEKYDTYQEEGPFTRIDLSANFRSREEVTETVNHVFERAMSREVGGVLYDDKAALHPGASYPPCEIGGSELLLVEKPGDDVQLDDREAEALVIAQQIQRLCRDHRVKDAHSGEMRPVEYRDIVILLRTLSGWGDPFKAALESQGIPAYVTSKSGYFTATEVQDVLNYLRIIDNPLQDVPLFGVMRSFFGGFTDEEIATLRGDKKRPLYESLLESEDPKVAGFLQRLNSFREMTSYLTIRALMERLLWEYDYVNYATALPGGSKRRANLEMLLVKASDFEKTSYFGLFHFLRYMDMLEKYEEDYGEADTLDENANVVRIMSIHKSKGLEFPVVFVAGVSKNFNMTDVNKAVITDPDLGIGMDFIDAGKRIKARTLRKSVITKKLREDTLAEELRLLYVAMTRAKEKIILTAVTADPETLYAESWISDEDDVRLSYLEFMKAKSFLDFLTPILRRTGMEVSVISMEDVQAGMLRDVLASEGSKENLENAGALADPAALQSLRESFAFHYPYANLEKLYVKTTVSELKIAAMSEKDEAAYHAFEDHETESYVPEFRRETQEVSGTVRGNAYHRVMELLDYKRILGEQFDVVPGTYEEYVAGLDGGKLAEAVRTFLEEKVAQSRLSKEYQDAVRVDRICRFVSYEIGYRAWRAQLAGKLFREQPFVLSIPATRLSESFPQEESVLIQGIIDLYLEEEDGIVLLDYKTDRVDSMEELWNRYETQLDHYQEALERLTGKPVKERILYSFSLGKYER